MMVSLDTVGAQEGDLDEGAHCEGTFVYQSCTDEQCLFGGELLFVPGSLTTATDDCFENTVHNHVVGLYS